MTTISKPRTSVVPAGLGRRGSRQQPHPAKPVPTAVVTLGVPPRASLLPQEVGIRQREASLRRRLIFGLVFVLLLAVAASGVAWLYAQGEQSKLTAEQANALQLQHQLSGYAPVKQVIAETATGTAAVKVGGSTDIAWGPYFTQLQSTLPAGVSLTDIKATSADISIPFAQQPLSEGAPRVATITITAASSSLPNIPSWINALSGLPGFLDAQPGGVTVTAGVYTATVTMDVGAAAFSHRYLPAKGATK